MRAVEVKDKISTEDIFSAEAQYFVCDLARTLHGEPAPGLNWRAQRADRPIRRESCSVIGALGGRLHSF
jgi:hypothetical protein